MPNHTIDWMNPPEFRTLIRNLADRGEIEKLVEIINALVDYVVKNDNSRDELSADIKIILEKEKT